MLGSPGDGWQLAMDLLPYERSTCFWHRIAYLYSRFDALMGEVRGLGTGRGPIWARRIWPCTRCAAAPAPPSSGWPTGTSWVRTPRSTRCCWPAPNSSSTTPHAICCPGAVELDDTEWRTEYLYSRAATIYGGTAEVQRNIIARRLLDLGKE